MAFRQPGGGGGSGTVTNVSGDGTSITGTNPTTTPVLTRAALSGDVAASAGSNTTALAATTNVGSIISSNPTVAGALQKANNLSDVADAGSSRFDLSIPTLSAVAVTVPYNVASLSGLNLYDGYQLLTNDEVLLTGQDTASQNGVWIAAAGAWSRPNEFPSGGLVKRGRFVTVVNGTEFANSLWFLQSTAAGLTIDTTAQVWMSLATSAAVANAARIAVLQPAATQPGSLGIATTSEVAGGGKAAIYGQSEMIIGDSTSDGAGTSNGGFGTRDWPSIYANQENRAAGLPDSSNGQVGTVNPPGNSMLPFVFPCGGGGAFNLPQWNAPNLGVSNNTAVANSLPSGPSGATPMCLQLTGAAGSASQAQDARIFRRVLLFFNYGAGYDNIAVSTNGGSSYPVTINGITGAVTGGGSTTLLTQGGFSIGVWDSGDLGAKYSTSLAVQRVTNGGTAPIIIATRYYITAGTKGLTIDSMGSGGTTSADWTANRLWETYLALMSPRRLHIQLGINDMLTAVSPATFQANLATIVQRAQAASALTEIVIHSTSFRSTVTQAAAGNVGYAGWKAQWVPIYGYIAATYGCSFVDQASRFGDNSYLRSVSDAVTNGTTTITSATIAWLNPEDVGAAITGTNIPYDTTIVQVVNGTTAIMSQPATGSGGGGTITVGGDVFALTMPTGGYGLHFGDATNSASGRDGQRAVAEFVRYSLGSEAQASEAGNLAAPVIFLSGGTWNPSTSGQAIFVADVCGGGASGANGGATSVGGGGGGGELLQRYYLGNVTTFQTVTVGAAQTTADTAGNPTSIGSLVTAAGGGAPFGGIGGKGGDGSPAGDQSDPIGGNTGAAYCSAGGGGAAGAPGGAGGPGLTRYAAGGGSGGGVNKSGGAGGSSIGGTGGSSVTSAGGGGGGGAGGNGGNGVATGGGNGGNGGNALANYGGGGGGGGAGTNSGGSGGNGASGFVIIYQIA